MSPEERNRQMKESMEKINEMLNELKKPSSSTSLRVGVQRFDLHQSLDPYRENDDVRYGLCPFPEGFGQFLQVRDTTQASLPRRRERPLRGLSPKQEKTR